MTDLVKLTEAVLACPPERDPYRHGASIYVAYEDVTSAQRAAVKSLTWLARYAEGHRFDPQAMRVRDEMVLQSKSTDRGGGMSAGSFLTAILNQPARDALLDLERVAKLVEPWTNPTHVPVPVAVNPPYGFGVPTSFMQQPGGLSSASTELDSWRAYVGRLRPIFIDDDVRNVELWYQREPPPRPRLWPRDYPEDVVRDVLAFVAHGNFTRRELDYFLLHTTKPATTIADACVRRATTERRIRWCPYSQQYVARPAWQHRPKRDRRGWRWPRSGHLRQGT